MGWLATSPQAQRSISPGGVVSRWNINAIHFWQNHPNYEDAKKVSMISWQLQRTMLGKERLVSWGSLQTTIQSKIWELFFSPKPLEKSTQNFSQLSQPAEAPPGPVSLFQRKAAVMLQSAWRRRAAQLRSSAVDGEFRCWKHTRNW